MTTPQRSLDFFGAAIAVLGAAVLFAGPLAAQPMIFHLDWLEVGVQDVDVDTESSKFDEYGDEDDGFQLHELAISGESAEGRYFLLDASDVRRDDARYLGRYGVWGEYGIRVSYDKIPHRFGNDALFIYQQTAPGRYEIADTIQGSFQSTLEDQFAANRGGINAAFVGDLLRPVLQAASRIDVGLQRDRTNAEIRLGGLTGLTWTLGYAQENRDGNRPYGGSFGFSNAIQILEPIDYTTRSAEVRGEWNAKRAGIQFGYRHSEFDNEISTLVWDNPFRLTDGSDGRAYISPGGASINGAARGFADLYPDNEADQLFAGGRVRFGPAGWAKASAAAGRMTQNDPFLPYTLNSAVVGEGFDGSSFDPTDPSTLPAASGDLEIRTLNLTLDAGTGIGDALELSFKYRYYDYDNRSRRIEFPGYVRFHAVWEEVPRISVPYSYTRETVGTELEWELSEGQELSAYYEQRTWDRQFRETTGTEEDVFGLRWDGRFDRTLTLRAGYEIGDRSIDGVYSTEAQLLSFLEPEGINNQPGLRKHLQAARKYDQYSLRGQWLCGESFDLALFFTGRDEDYGESEFGLLSSDVTTYGLEAGFMPAPGTALYGFVHREERDLFQRARQSGGTLSTDPADDWQARFDETTDTWGLGLTRQGVDRWSWDLSLRWSDSDGNADFFSPPGGNPDLATGFEDYDDVQWLTVQAETGYAITDQVTAGVSYRYEDFSIDRFLVDQLEHYIASAILLLPNDRDYKANVYGVHLRFEL